MQDHLVINAFKTCIKMTKYVLDLLHFTQKYAIKELKSAYGIALKIRRSVVVWKRKYLATWAKSKNFHPNQRSRDLISSPQFEE